MREKGENEGELIVVDGLDGIGKGVVERALIAYEQKLGRAVFDTIAHSKGYDRLPNPEEIWNPPIPHFNTMVTAEPTYAGIGKVIREEVIKNNGRPYSAETERSMYADDRLVQMMQFANPLRVAGVRDIRSRSVTSSLCYQVIRAENEGMTKETARKKVLAEEGNKLALEWAPSLLIIPTIDSAEKVIGRIKGRKDSQKDDDSIFDNLKFQETLKRHFEDPWLRNLFTRRGTVVAYMNAGVSEQATRDQTVEIYRSFLTRGKVPDKYSSPKDALKIK